ncbi:uncharacterized protein [Nicotiana sylvestris]|uniref:Uncharacterized protein LOC104218499 isoform X1 n=1 Tax=Nicotiana sylvestris TaxID=4096 RepID=A0A1U7VLR6_NICSY|nr:PREDICTED: uncharacterized protein LOC104218499 isoform X1 [Nicotiana sylvestris]
MPNKSHKNENFEKIYADKKARRRELYRMMQSDKKEVLLARARANKAQTSRRQHAASSLINSSANPSSSMSANSSSEQCAPFMGYSTLYETGSTSNTNHEQYNKVSVTTQVSPQYIMLKTVPKCKFCGAKKIEYEPPAFCCRNGTVKLSSHQVPTELRNLYLGNTEESKHFRTYIRAYSNIFAFTSLGVTYDRELAKRNKGIYTFRVQGQMYHFINDLIPSNEKGRNLQLYFFDSENEMRNRMACSDKLNKCTVKSLMEILEINPYSIFLKSLINIPQLSNFYIALKCDAGLDQRIYNLLTTSEVAGICVEQDTNNCIPTPHIRIYTKSDGSQLINYYYGCYDPLQYLLLFPYGQNGWHCGIKKLKPPTTPSRTQMYCKYKQLPNVTNMTSIDGFLDMEAEVMQKGKRKREIVSCLLPTLNKR